MFKSTFSFQLTCFAFFLKNFSFIDMFYGKRKEYNIDVDYV